MAKPWEGEGGSFGSWLRQQREIRNISLREISDNTKIGLRYLEALEEDRFEVLPASIFAKGFLREYAKYVGLDPDEVVNFYLTAEQRYRIERGDDISGVLPLPTGGSTVVPPRGRHLEWVLLALGGIIIVLAAAGIFWWVRHHGQTRKNLPQAEATPSTIAPVAPPPAPNLAPPAPAVVNPNAPIVVTLSFTAECWVEAVVDDDRNIGELRVQGESMRIEARDSVLLKTLGNAPAVRVDVNGRPLKLPPGVGQVVHDLLIDRATAGLAPAPTPVPPVVQRPRVAPASTPVQAPLQPTTVATPSPAHP
jgi:cytoskeleton protein RodZ